MSARDPLPPAKYTRGVRRLASIPRLTGEAWELVGLCRKLELIYADHPRASIQLVALAGLADVYLGDKDDAVMRACAALERCAAAIDRTQRATGKRERTRCGARTRKGSPCRAPAVWDRHRDAPRNGRCRMHGGRSTGPRTPEGKARIAESNRRRSANRREGQGV